MQQPLAIKLRPTKLDEVYGQKHIIAPGMILDNCVKQQHLVSMIFFGPPGCGKTTLALAIAGSLNLPYRLFSAVEGNKKDLTEIFEEAKIANGLIVIIDEIHRLNKDKQDLLLPHIESGLITVIGATTANPFFAINPAIRSRCQLLEVKPLEKEDIVLAINNAITLPKGLNGKYTIEPKAVDIIAQHSNGDLRYAYNLLEICSLGCINNHIDEQLVRKYSHVTNMNFDSSDDGHYDAVSAFQKSIRGSDVNAALYYLARLILANDMDSIERRLLVIAYEDIGLANPAACGRTINAIDAAKRVGFPEAMIPLGVAVIDLCLSPKSRSGVSAIEEAVSFVSENPLDVPIYLKLNPVALDDAEKYSSMDISKAHKLQYLPDQFKDLQFYHPTDRGYEKQLFDNYEKLKQIYRVNKVSKIK